METKKRKNGYIVEDGILLVSKKVGETMGELVERCREEFSLEEEKITFAGRLDPLASGVSLLLYGERRFEKELFLKHDKKYSFDIVFGITTDTGDVLGIVESISERSIAEDKLVERLTSMVGEFSDTYPLFSSRKVRGRALFDYARAGEEVTLPQYTGEIYSVQLESFRLSSRNSFLEDVYSRISSLSGDFRQKEIMEKWKSVEESLSEDISIARIAVHVSSGVYMRGIAKSVGEKLGGCAIADAIVRDAIGGYTL